MSKVANVVQHYAQKNVADIQNQWDGSRIEGEAKIDFKITADTPGLIAGEYRASGQKMWILEHGSGSLMDDGVENPGLASYKQSDLWNDERENEEIRTRQGPYLDLDRQQQMGSGIGGEHGLNAEKLNHGQISIAENPRHIIAETLTSKTAINEELKTSLLNSVGSDIRANIRRVL